MDTRLTRQVLIHCIGSGELALKGKARRLWLTLKRLETERQYIGQQVASIKRYHPAVLRVDRDQVPTKGLYELERARIQSEEFWRAYELLYPHGEKRLSLDALELTGMEGAVAFWLDRGSIRGRRGRLEGPYDEEEMEAVAEWMTGLGYPAKLFKRPMCRHHALVRMERESLLSWLKAARPYTPMNMRHRLRGVSAVES